MLIKKLCNFQTPLWIFLIFGMGVVLMILLRKSYPICQESSDTAKCWPFKMKICPVFLPKLTVLKVFDLQLPNAAINLPNFWYGSCSYGVLWKMIFCMPWKFKDVQNLTIFDQISALLWVFSLHLPKTVADLLSFLNSLNFDSYQSYCVLLVSRL